MFDFFQQDMHMDKHLLLLTVLDSQVLMGATRFQTHPFFTTTAQKEERKNVFTTTEYNIILQKLFGLGPVENRPSTDWLHHFVQ